jgi:GTPase SAR1 family protein
LKKIISLVDNLRDLGLDELIKLPKVVVVGSQSAGKSSLLEQIVGIDFLPRGSGVVTRRPLELRLTYDPKLKQAIGKFDEIPGETFTDFNKVRDKINYVTDKVCGSNKNIVDKPIILNISSPSCPTITIVDLPGITSNPVGDQPTNIYDITKGLVMKYV